MFYINSVEIWIEKISFFLIVKFIIFISDKVDFDLVVFLIGIKFIFFIFDFM